MGYASTKMVLMNQSPRSSAFQNVQNAQCKVVRGQIGDSSSAWQLVYTLLHLGQVT